MRGESSGCGSFKQLKRIFIEMVRKKTIRLFLKNLSLFCALVVLAFVVGEYATRTYFRDITTTSSNGSYFTIRWARENIRHNSWWFRDREVDVKNPEGAIRIAIIGDSVTFGRGIREEDRFSNRLEDYLNAVESSCHFEVLNFGWPGSETIDHLNVFKNTVFKVHPDFVLLQWSINDVEGPDKSGLPEQISLIPIHSIHFLLYRVSAFYFLLDLQWQMIIQSICRSTSYEGYLFQRFGDPESPDSREYVDLLKELVGECRKREIPLGLILFPYVVPDLAESYPFRYLHELVRAVCDQEGVPCVDLLDTYAQYRDHKALWVNRFDNHPSPLAHRLAAEKLMERFGEMWLEGAVHAENGFSSTWR